MAKEKEDKEFEESIRKKGIDTDKIKKLFYIEKLSGKDPINELLNSLWEKINSQIDLLEDLVNPEGDPLLLFELEVLNEEDKNTALRILKRFMYLKRKKEIAQVENDEEKKREVVNEIIKEWENNKTEISRLLKKLMKRWLSDESSEDEKRTYLG